MRHPFNITVNHDEFRNVRVRAVSSHARRNPWKNENHEIMNRASQPDPRRQ